MLKMLKVQINVDLKADPSDEEDLKDRLYSALGLLMEEEELEYTFDTDEEELELED